jgi:hypothetical protein
MEEMMSEATEIEKNEEVLNDTDGNEFTLSREAILGYCTRKHGKTEFMEHLVLESLTNAIKHKDLREFLKGVGWETEDGGDKKQFECCLLFEGHKFPLAELCAHWEEQMDMMIRKKAYELLKENGLAQLDHMAYEFSEEIKRRAKKELKLDLEDW